MGKTESVKAFAHKNYESVFIINFCPPPKKYRSIFDDGYEEERIIKKISFLNPSLKFISGKTILFFDERQACPDCATSLESFMIDGKYDVICSGSLMGINYKDIESNSVGYKEDYEMHSMDFEEFLWALGYDDASVEDLYSHMKGLVPFTELEMNVMLEHFHNYMTIGGMPAVVNPFVKNGNS